MKNNIFDNKNVNLEVLKKRAYNYRWAETEEGVIPLTAADPDFPVAKEIVENLTEYIKDGYFSYAPHTGLESFKESIAKSLNERKNEHVSKELVLPIDSVARGMYIVAETVLKEGDEVIIFDPVDYLFRESTLAAGGVPVLFPAKLKDGYIDLSELESYITRKTKMICLCNPHNPLGAVYSEKDLDHILSLSEKYDLWIMNDEIWSDIVFGERPFKSICSLGADRNKKTLSVFGFSKGFGIAGLRAGCIYAHDTEIFNKIVKTSNVMTTAGGISTLSQIAGITCLDECYYWTEQFIEYLKTNRDYAVDRLNNMPGITCHKPFATYLLFPNIEGTGFDSDELKERLLSEAKLAIVPGNEKFFGPGAKGHIRICFSTSFEILKEGLDRLENWLKSNKK